MKTRYVVSLLAVALAFGCRSDTYQSELPDESSLGRTRILGFVNYVSVRIERAADDIAERSSDTEIDRRTVYWKLRAIPLVQNAVKRRDEQSVALELWVLATGMVKAFAEMESPVFGDEQPIAQGAAEDIETRARELAGTLLTPEQFKQAEPLVSEYVETHLTEVGLVHSPTETRDWGTTIGGVLKKPLDVIQAPFSSFDLTSGLSDTAVAMHRFTDEFTRARVQLDHLPSELRWNIQLLLMQVEEVIHLSKMVDGVAEIGASANSISETAKTLPANLRAELATLSGELSENLTEGIAKGLAKGLEVNQPGIQATLKEANATLANTQQTAKDLGAMSATMTTTFEAFAEIVKSFGPDPDQPTPPPATEAEGPPFNINDYAHTAEKLTETAQALTGLFDDFEKLSSTSETPPLLLGTEASLRSLLDRLLLGGGALVLFIALVAYGYRLALARLPSARI